MYHRYLLLLGAPLLALALSGCPHHVSEMIDEMTPPEDYDPGFLSATIDFGDLIGEQGEETISDIGRLSIPDTLYAENRSESGELPRVKGTRVGPIVMDVRSVDDSRYPDEVVVQAYVYDTAGRYISGLAPPDFQGSGTFRDYWTTLLDSCGGVGKMVEEYRVEEISEESRQAYSIAIALDHSSSMGAPRVRILRRAVALLLRGISKRDNVGIISFSSHSSSEVTMTASKREWVTRFDSADLSRYGGGTALYDAVHNGVFELKKGAVGSKRILILFSDGGDGNSSATLESAYRAARDNDVTIYTIAYGPADVETLSALASYSGGRMYRIYSSGEFLDVFIDLYRRLTRYYRITYAPPECAGLHLVRPTLAIPEFGIDRLFGEGVYDRSIITPFDSVGSAVLVAIEFAYDKAIVQEESLPRINEVVEAMRRNPAMEIEIRGHTDDAGEEEYNLRLSERRAAAVADLIVAAGIDRGRLRIRGFGESRPLVPNDTEENRRKNRRTEFVIIKK